MNGETATILVLLLACLVALVLVLLARREAAVARTRASQDVEAIRAEAQSLLADAQRREERSIERERELKAERGEVRALNEVAEQRLAQAQDQRAAAARAAGVAQAEGAERLAAISGMTADEARAHQLKLAAEQVSNDAAARVRRAEAAARRTAEARARSIVATAVQRVAAATSSQAVVTVVPLPAEDMKGRIIGKEGRNIRTFEAITGVNVIIDDTPEAITLSCFDAERREVAVVAMEALIADGRIHPQRIELAYAEALAGAGERAVAAGHEAAERAGVSGLHPEVVATLGRLRLRTSYGQTVLAHLVESAQIAAGMAAELGADVEAARRGAFLHDVGKAMTSELGGTHALVGADLLRRCGESSAVVNAVASHHDEVPKETLEAVLVQAADACSAARPGARREELDQYIDRMDTLEALVTAHAGVRRAVAMSAGREVRVVVEPDEVDDAAMAGLAEAIARHIEKDLSFPGEIAVTVVRELRATATAG